MLAAFNLEKYKPEKPQIAKVLVLKEDGMIEVLWYYGSWSGNWRIYKKREGRNLIESKEIVSIYSVKLFNFIFTPLGKLKLSVKDDLKALYGSAIAD